MLMSYHNILLYLPPLLFQVCVRVRVPVRVKALSQSLSISFKRSLNLSPSESLSFCISFFAFSIVTVPCSYCFSFFTKTQHKDFILCLLLFFRQAKSNTSERSLKFLIKSCDPEIVQYVLVSLHHIFDYLD